jgi:hypothetical protein
LVPADGEYRDSLHCATCRDLSKGNCGQEGGGASSLGGRFVIWKGLSKLLRAPAPGGPPLLPPALAAYVIAEVTSEKKSVPWFYPCCCPSRS